MKTINKDVNGINVVVRIAENREEMNDLQDRTPKANEIYFANGILLANNGYCLPVEIFRDLVRRCPHINVYEADEDIDYENEEDCERAEEMEDEWLEEMDEMAEQAFESGDPLVLFYQREMWETRNIRDVDLFGEALPGIWED